MSGSLIPNGKQQYFDANGTPLAGGKVYYYIPYTTTAKNTWQDINLSILNTNPIILDAAGECIAWGAGAYRQQVYDVNNNLIWDQYTYGISPTGSNFISQEEVQTATQGQTAFSLTTITYTPGINSLVVFVNGSKQLVNVNYTETSSSVVTFASGLNVGDVVDFYASLPASAQNLSNAANVAYIPPYVNSVGTNVQAKLAQYVSILDFGADPTGTNDSTTAIQNAINAIGNRGLLYAPKGTYLISNTITLKYGINFYGDGYEAVNGTNTPLDGTIFKWTGSAGTSGSNIPMFYLNGGSSATVYNSNQFTNFACYNQSGSAYVTAIKVNNSNWVSVSRLYISGFDIGVEQGVNCYQWSVDNVKIIGITSICWYAHDEGEDSTYTDCLFRSYSSTGTGVQLSNMSQTNVFIGCDFSDNLRGAYLNQGDTNGNGTGTPYPMNATFINCQFEDIISAAIVLVTSNQNAAQNLHPGVTAIGCRGFISGTWSPAVVNNGQSFIYATHASQISVDTPFVNYDYGVTLGVAAYGYYYGGGTACGPALWGNDNGSVWRLARFNGNVGNNTLQIGDHQLIKLNSVTTILTFSGGYANTNFTNVVTNKYGWLNGSNLIQPSRSQTVRFKCQVRLISATAGNYQLFIKKNATTLYVMDEVYVASSGQDVFLAGEFFDIPNGTSDFYATQIYTSSGASTITFDTTNSYLFAEVCGN